MCYVLWLWMFQEWQAAGNIAGNAGCFICYSYPSPQIDSKHQKVKNPKVGVCDSVLDNAVGVFSIMFVAHQLKIPVLSFE